MVRFLLMMLLGLMAAQPVWSQDSPSDEVLLRVVSIGVGNLGRASDWNGVLIEFQDQGPAQREVVIEVQTRDVDGDRPRYQRTVTTNPGAGAERVWVYAYCQPADEDRPLIVSAYEALPAASGRDEITGVRYEAGALLGRVTTAGQPLRAPELATMLVVGRQPAGLAGYSSRLSSSDLWMARGHEVTDMAGDLAPGALPDRVVGYAGIETIVWTTADPTRLTPSRAEAIREWVRNGGHLVISLPASPQVWLDPVRNPLADLLPASEPRRSSAGPEPLRGLLTYDDGDAIPESLVIHDLATRASASPFEAWPVLKDSSGRTVVSRRRIELGSVSLIGFDVTNRTLASRGMPGMRPFWHRVLGRTGLAREASNPERVSIVQNQPRIVDADIADVIAKNEAVVVGVLSGFAAFGLYWLIAAPVSYAVLSKLSLKSHSWLVFVGCVGVFAGVSWGGVMLLRPGATEVQTVLFLDTAEGTTRHSVRAFSTVLIPRYGEDSLRVGTDEPEETAAIAPWADPGAGGGSVVAGNFPDVRGYAVSGRDPSRMEFPVRSTVKTVRTDWSGERLWASFRAIDADGRPSRLTLDSAGSIQGSITHGFPYPVEDAVVLVVPPQDRIAKRVGQADIASVRVRRLSSAEWDAGRTVDLHEMFTPASEVDAAASRQRDRDFFADLAGVGKPTAIADVALSRTVNQTDRLLATALMSRMPPEMPGTSGGRPIGLRRATHGLDLGEWFTQPAVIVLGIVRLGEESELPFPLSIDSGSGWQRLRGEGIAVVRWVYTLPASPPDAQPSTEDSEG